MGLHNEEWRRIRLSPAPWMCPNCTLHVHQCFHCKKDGVYGGPVGSDGTFGSLPLEPVTKCIIYECGRFYHSKCLKAANKVYSHDGPIVRRKRGYILITDQSDAESVGIFS